MYTYPLGLSIQFNAGSAQGSNIQYFYADYAITPATSSGVEPVIGTAMIPAGNSTVNITLPAYNGWNYNVSVYAVNSIGTSDPANIAFVLAVGPRYEPISFMLFVDKRN